MAIGALLYTAVGHAGASAYLAIMAFFSVAPDVMKPTALVLNILVASFASWRFIRADQFDKRLIVPLLAGSLPLAFFGGGLLLSGAIYRPLLALMLMLAAARLLWPRPIHAQAQIMRPPSWIAISAGAGIGLLSGLTGTGGGIFLSPIVIFKGWAEPCRASGIASVFILLNSVAGLAGNLSSVGRLPHELPYFMGAVALGAAMGTRLGTSKKLPSGRLLQLLGVVLLIAAAKLAFT
ncbi:MAG: sulfite exporter TauE/SafE family protein [Sphingopyxis sp.]